MTITLSPALEAIVAEKVKSGGYETAEQVVSTGIGLLDRISSADHEKLRQLRHDVASARASASSGDVALVDMKAIVAKPASILDG